MDIDELLSLLDSRTISVMKYGLLSKKFNGATLLGGILRITLSDKTAIRFAPVSYFNELPETHIEDAAFFLYADAPLKPVTGNTFVAIMRHRTDWVSAFEVISAEFRLLQKKKEQVLHLTELVNRNASLNSIVNEAANIVDAPASVLDNSLAFLAHSDNFPKYVAYGEEETTGMVPDTALPLLKAKGLVNPQKPFDLVVFDWTSKEGTFTNHFCLIHSRDTIIGSISFITQDGPLRTSRLEMIPTIAQILSIYLSRSNAFMLNKSLFYTYMFKQLEEGALNLSRKKIEERFSLFGYQLKRHLNVVYVDFSEEYLPSERVKALAENIHPYISNSVYTMNETSIVFLSSSDEIAEEGPCDIEALEEAFAGTKVAAGISSVFLDPRRTPSYIEEARRALRTGRDLDPNLRVFPFARYRLLDMVESVLDRKTLYSYRYPPLMHVIDQDKKNNAHLAYTLYEYLQDPAHPADVAKKLFIHKNTLYYRLDKIREIMGRDFRDAETISCIQMTFHVLRVQNRFDKLVLRTKEESE